MRTVLQVSCVVLALGVSACFVPPGALMQAVGDPTAASDEAIAAQVEQARADAELQPGDVQSAARYGQMLAVAYDGGVVLRGHLDGPKHLADAIAKLDAAAQAQPEQAWQAYATMGFVLQTAGQPKDAEQALEASMEATPNTQALSMLIPIYVDARRHDEIDVHCAQTYGTARDKDGQFAILETCARARPGMGAAAALPWASPEAVAFYEQQHAIEEARAQAQAEAYERQREEERAALQASFSTPSQGTGTGGGATPGAAAGPQRASVTLHSGCRDRVRVFFGDKPKYGSGTYSWISANSVSSYSMDAGDMLWIVDEHDNPISSTSAPAGSSRIEILESCTGFRLN